MRQRTYWKRFSSPGSPPRLRSLWGLLSPLGLDEFSEPINSLPCIYTNTELWKTIESLEKAKEGFLIVLNAANMPLGMIDRNKIGCFVLNKMGLNLSNEMTQKLISKNGYPLGLELPKIIYLMKKKGDIE